MSAHMSSGSGPVDRTVFSAAPNGRSSGGGHPSWAASQLHQACTAMLGTSVAISVIARNLSLASMSSSHGPGAAFIFLNAPRGIARTTSSN